MTVVRRVAARARDERGLSLVETLAGMVIAMGILLAAFKLLDASAQLSTRTQGRVDALQRGRQTMDLMTRELRSQVCLSASRPSIVSADGRSVTFYADLGDGTQPPQRRVLAYNAAGRGSITEQIFVGTGAPPATTYTTPPTTTTLLTHVQPSPDVPAVGGVTPIFRYYAFDDQAPPRPERLLSAPLSVADIPVAARIAIDYAVRPTGATAAATEDTVVADEVFLRSTDPHLANPTPQCS